MEHINYSINQEVLMKKSDDGIWDKASKKVWGEKPSFRKGTGYHLTFVYL